MEKGTKRPIPFDRRAAERFRAPLRVELWPHGVERTEPPKLEVRDFSQRGFYFFSERGRDLGSRFNFSVLFRRPISGQEGVLLRGLAQVVRCEDVGSTRPDHFGIAAKIEEITYEVGDRGN